MTETRMYLVPDYYLDFSCKMGACRSACCVGWPITLSMKDYFHLLGVDCSKSLRGRIDCAMHVLERPTRERYAQISPRYDGDCPMRLDDGRCAVQAELGEDALSDVCRLYPRAPRTEGDCECSCANSCEAVLELLFRRDEPIGFRPMPLRFNLPDQTERTVFFETVGREQEIRLYLIRRMQDRSLPFPLRLMAFGESLRAMEAALDAKDERLVERLLANEASARAPVPPVGGEGLPLAFGLRVAEDMIALIDERSRSVRAYGEAALAYFGKGDTASMERYRLANDHFNEVLPRWPVYFEHMLVNHMFFERFPFQDRPETLRDEFIALCGVYAVLRFLGLGWMADKRGESSFVDVASAAFRLIDHTSFDRYAAHTLKGLGCDDPERVYRLVCL